MRSAAAIITVILCAIAAAVTVVLLRGAAGHAPAGAAGTPAVIAVPAPVRMPLRIGVVADDLTAFEQASGTYPSIEVKYVQWGAPFPSAAVLRDHGLGVTLMIVLEPGRASLPGIAAGRDGAYLAAWGRADRALGLPVILSFAPEANGDWYSWGDRHISALTYRRMWRSVHDELTAAGARHVTWVWQVNSVWATSEPLGLLWPGSRYVDEIGIDGQLGSRSATFSSVFGETVAQIRAITSRPIMISEASVGSSPRRPAQITGLFAGAVADHLSALILFDVHSKWEIDDDPAALAAFRAAAKRYG